MLIPRGQILAHKIIIIQTLNLVYLHGSSCCIGDAQSQHPAGNQ